MKGAFGEFYKFYMKLPGPGCTELKSLLVNVSFTFQTLIFQTRKFFLVKKCEKAFLIFSTKNFSLFGYKVIKHLTN